MSNCNRIYALGMHSHVKRGNERATSIVDVQDKAIPEHLKIGK